MSRSWVGGSTTAWRKVRILVLTRDGYRCRAHGEGWCDAVPTPHACTGRASHAHHTRGRAITGDDPEHIIAACPSCNLHIGDPVKVNPQPRRVTRW